MHQSLSAGPVASIASPRSTHSQPSVLVIALLAQLAVTTQPVKPVQPVLAFPDAALDDTMAYRGYQTRFYRDAARNTLQLYIDQRSARVVHLMADADNASIGFTARTGQGDVAPLAWAAPGASVGMHGGVREFSHALVARTRTLHLGWFLLGSMRVERDFQYFQKARESFDAAPYAIPEVDRMIVALAQLPAATRTRHLARLRAGSVEALRARMYPSPTLRRAGSSWVARIVQPTLDARDTLTIELRTDTARVMASVAGDSLSMIARSGDTIAFTVRITTTATPLTPLSRNQIFTTDFLAFVESVRKRGAAAPAGDTAAIRARRMERQVSGVELLVSREKLMAGLPTYATYFGRDMLMTALMMRPIWRHETMEAVIATALRKLAPRGDVSHEEALGDQAVRESAAAYATLASSAATAAARNDRRGADSLLARAELVLRDLRVPRENYHMVDDEYQLPIVVARWITDPQVSVAAKRAFLLDRRDGNGSRAERLMRELALVAQLSAAYAAAPVTTNLIAFAPRSPSGFESASWRDSGAGYAGGRYPMDINAIWVPHALEALGQIVRGMRDVGIAVEPMTARDPVLSRYVRDDAALQRAIATWRTASRHFIVQQSPAQVQSATAARLAAMPEVERTWWQTRTTTAAATRDSITFLAVALDAAGAPIPVANTDPATQLFLGDGQGLTDASTLQEQASALRDAALFARPYPAGLFVDRLGPVVANDAYASPAVWDAFVKDPYHGPRVVWGREVNLFLLGVANRVATARASRDGAAYADTLATALDKVRTAVEQSGFHTELWSYGFEAGQLRAMRYGSGADIQLWSTTDLAVQYVLSRMAR